MERQPVEIATKKEKEASPTNSIESDLREKCVQRFRKKEKKRR